MIKQFFSQNENFNYEPFVKNYKIMRLFINFLKFKGGLCNFVSLVQIISFLSELIYAPPTLNLICIFKLKNTKYKVIIQ